MKLNDYPDASNAVITKALGVIADEVRQHNPHVDAQALRQALMATIDQEVNRRLGVQRGMESRRLPPLDSVGPMRNRGAR